MRRAAWILAEGVAALVAGGAAFVASLPHLGPRFATHLWGWQSSGDLGGTLFMVARSLTGDRGPTTRLLQWPWGCDLGGTFTNPWLTDGMAVLVRHLGEPRGYNLAVLLLAASNGMAVHLVTRLAGGGVLPALCAAALASALPLVAGEMLEGRLVTAWVAPVLAGYGLCLHALRSWRTLPWAAVGVGLLALAVGTYGYYGLFLAPWVLGAGLVRVARREVGPWLRAGIVTGLGAAVLLPLALQVVGQVKMTLLLQAPVPGPSWTVARWFTTGGTAPDLDRLPAVLLALALLASLVAWRRVLDWGPMALATGLLLALSLGTNLEGLEKVSDPRMPFTWLFARVPLLWGCPRPIRFAIPAAALACCWLGVALSGIPGRAGPGSSTRARLLPWVHPSPWISLLGVGLALFMARSAPGAVPLMGWPPLPGLHLMADQAVGLDLPLQRWRFFSNFALVGMVPVPRFNPPRDEAQDARWRSTRDPDATPLLAAVAAIEGGEPVPEGVWTRLREGIPEVEEWGLERVMVHRYAEDAHRIRTWEAFLGDLGASRVYEDPYVSVWELPRQGTRAP